MVLFSPACLLQSCASATATHSAEGCYMRHHYRTSDALLQTPNPCDAGFNLPVELRPDVAHFDAGALATVSLSPAYGTVSQLWDQRTAPQGDRTDQSLPYQVLNFRGDCKYDGSAEGGGGSVLFDGSSCHAEMNLRLCDWEDMAGGWFGGGRWNPVTVAGLWRHGGNDGCCKDGRTWRVGGSLVVRSASAGVRWLACVSGGPVRKPCVAVAHVHAVT